jgi:hypothetical protein
MRFLISSLIAFLIATPAAAGWLDGYIDPEDGKFDMSDWLLQQHGWLPVPTFITEPAVGYGLALAGVNFQLPQGPDAGASHTPTIAAIAGVYTESDTWGAAAAYFGPWKGDRMRYVGAAGYFDANLDFYIRDHPVGYNLSGWGLFQQITFRISGSDFFVGPRYVLVSSDVEFDRPGGIPGIDPDLEFANAGLSAVCVFDNQNNILSPTQGHRLNLVVTRYDDAFGGDYEYWQADAELDSYRPLHREWFFGFKLEGSTIDGRAPFWSLPFVDLRGVPWLRYQGESAVSFETEFRWEFVPRWSVLAFAGVGSSWKGDTILASDETAFSGGAGFRYLLARKLGLLSGVDVARGPEDWAFYIQVGQAWGR